MKLLIFYINLIVITFSLLTYFYIETCAYIGFIIYPCLSIFLFLCLRNVTIKEEIHWSYYTAAAMSILVFTLLYQCIVKVSELGEISRLSNGFIFIPSVVLSFVIYVQMCTMLSNGMCKGGALDN